MPKATVVCMLFISCYVSLTLMKDNVFRTKYVYMLSLVRNSLPWVVTVVSNSIKFLLTKSNKKSSN